MSRSQGKPFYSHAATGRTSWDKPTNESEAKYQESIREKEDKATSASDKKDQATPALAVKEVAAAQDAKKETSAPASASAGTARAAPLGPASWRSAQGQGNDGRRFGNGNGQGNGGNRSRDPEPDSPWEREAKRSRKVSPANTGGVNVNGANAEPSKRTFSYPLYSWNPMVDLSRYGHSSLPFFGVHGTA
jgi:hypothetical protein